MCKRLGLLALLAAAAASAVETAPFSLLPPDTGVVMGLGIGRIRASAMGRALSALFEQQFGKVDLMAGAGALALYNGIDDVTIAIPQRARGRGLVVIRGNFSRGDFDQWVHPQAVSTAVVQGVRIVTIKSAKNSALNAPAVAFIDQATILGGDAPSVREAIARRTRPGTLASSLAAKAGQFRLSHEFWLVADVPPEGLGAATPASPQAKQMAAFAKSVEQLSVGINFDDSQFDLNAELLARTPEDAGALANGLRLLGAMAASNKQPQARSLAPLVDHMVIRPEGRIVKLDITLTQEQFRQYMPKAGLKAAAPAVNPNEVTIYSSPKDMGTVKIKQ